MTKKQEIDKNSNNNVEKNEIFLGDREETIRKLIAAREEKETERNITQEGQPLLNQDQTQIYQQVLVLLNDHGIKYAVGAAFARNAYTHVWRPTKDLDIFLKAEDLKTTLDILEQAGFQTEVIEYHWLAKAWKGSYFIDFIFGAGHNQIQVDDDFLSNCESMEILGVNTKLVPVEELIAAACYIKERTRFDGSDSMHLILSTKGNLDWQRIIDRLGENRELLLIDLLLFNFIYPGHSDYLPQDLVYTLFQDVQQRWAEGSMDPKTFRGSLLDPFSYSVDLEAWGYEDQRNIHPLVDDQGELL